MFRNRLGVCVGAGRDLTCLHHHRLLASFKKFHFKPLKINIRFKVHPFSFVHTNQPPVVKNFSIHLGVRVGTGRDLSCLHNHSVFVLFKNLHLKSFENKYSV